MGNGNNRLAGCAQVREPRKQPKPELAWALTPGRAEREPPGFVLGVSVAVMLAQPAPRPSLPLAPVQLYQPRIDFQIPGAEKPGGFHRSSERARIPAELCILGWNTAGGNLRAPSRAETHVLVPLDAPALVPWGTPVANQQHVAHGQLPAARPVRTRSRVALAVAIS